MPASSPPSCRRDSGCRPPGRGRPDRVGPPQGRDRRRAGRIDDAAAADHDDPERVRLPGRRREDPGPAADDHAHHAAARGRERRGLAAHPRRSRLSAVTGVSDLGIDGSGTERALCVLAPNPSPLTLEGTNTWVVAEPDSPAVVVVDPGPEDEGHLTRVLDVASAGDRRVALIVLTHGHPDHAAGAARFAALSGAPVAALDPAQRLGSDGYAAGAVITAAGCAVRVVGTPGHSGDSLSLLLEADGALLTGDTVLGRGTTVIGPDGSLGDY